MEIILNEQNRKVIRVKRASGSTILSFMITMLILLMMPLFLACLIIVIKTLLYPNKIPDVIGYKPLIELTDTMQDTLYYGDLAFIKIVDADTLKKGDVIAFRNEDNTVTIHRIVNMIEREGNRFFATKGDALKRADIKLVNEKMIEGIYTGRMANVGNICLFIHRPIVLIVAIVLILVVGAISLPIAAKLDEKELEEIEQEKQKQILKEFWYNSL